MMKHTTIDVEMEMSTLFLALKLTKQVELCRLSCTDDFELFRTFTQIIREYENEKRRKRNK